MITRNGFHRNYNAVSPMRDTTPGLIRGVVIDGVLQTWAISRPVGAYHPDCAPQYLDMPVQNCAPRNQLLRTDTPVLQCSQPLIAMDPSDSSTWQRRYVFPAN